jgi:hydrogenase-4 component F
MTAVIVLLSLPLAAALLCLTVRSPRTLHSATLAAMSAILGAVLILTARLLDRGPFLVYNDLFSIDGLAVLVLWIIAVIGVIFSLYSRTYLDRYLERGVLTPGRIARYYVLFHLFVFAMVAATLVNSLGLLWVAIEGTTLATTFLINFFKRRESLEAGWKYLILCSVGIALALFGTVLMYSSSVRALGDVSAALNVTELLRVADRLDPQIVKVAFLFILVGYGTKMGLAPMHTWVPDAYSEAPAPVAGMLAGVLETVAVYAILRSKTVVDAVVSPGYAGSLFMIFGFLSFGVAAFFLLLQKDLKRLLAYSSIEHMGIAAIGFGAGSIGTFGGLLHLLGHALAKSLAFFAAGNIQLRFGTRKIDRIRGLARVQPVTALALVVASLVLVGMPPFTLFTSEISVLSALSTQVYAGDTFHVGRFLTITVADGVRNMALVAVFLSVGLVAFGGMMYRVMGMIWGTPGETVERGEAFDPGHAAMALAGGLLVILGVMIPGSIGNLMDMAVQSVTNALARQ